MGGADLQGSATPQTRGGGEAEAPAFADQSWSLEPQARLLCSLLTHADIVWRRSHYIRQRNRLLAKY